MPDRTAAVILSLQTTAAPQLRQLADGTRALTSAQIGQITAAQRLATQNNQTAVSAQRLQTEEQRTAIQVANAARAQDQASLSALRLAQAQDKAARSSSLAGQFADGLKSGLLGIVGPAALATAAIGALVGTADSFKEAFNFKAQLDATSLSIQTTLAGVRDSGRVFEEAAAFGDKYRLTQEQTNAILASSTDILRSSTSSVGSLESALLRLQSRDVSKPISEAARALRELNSGDVTSVKELFNVPAAEALRMKNEIIAGGDAVQVLNGYLDRAGVGTEVLANRAKGVAGAFNELAIAQEQLKLAQADFAQGPGLVILQGQINTTRDVTKLLQGDVRGLNDILKDTGLASGNSLLGPLKDTGIGAINPLLTSIQAYNSFVLDAGRNALVWAGAIKDTSTAAQVQTDIEGLRAQRISASNAVTVSQIDIEDRRVQQLNAMAEASGTAIRGQVDAINQSASASVVDAAAKDAQQKTTALLAAQTKQSVDGFLALNPAIDASGVAALVSAGKLDPFIGRLVALRLQSDEAAGALGRLNLAQGIAQGAAALVPENRRIGGTGNTVGGVASGIGGGAGGLFAQTSSQQQALQASRDALALANARSSAQRIAIYQQQLARQTTEEGRNRILAQIAQEKQSGAGRVGAAQNTALQLNQVEQNSGAQLLRTQRENLERLRDQAEDFDVRRSRAQEDFAEKRRGLLARGQRAQADALSRDFAKEQRRAQEDFDRQNRRTLRNNAEATGDIGDRTDLRQQQIGDRAALRGTPVSGARTSGTVPSVVPGGAGAIAAPRGAQPIAQITIQGVVNLDGKAVGTAIYPIIEVQIDENLAVALAAINPPGSVQQAVAGAG